VLCAIAILGKAAVRAPHPSSAAELVRTLLRESGPLAWAACPRGFLRS
jgi:hypothetical protein